MKKVIVLTAVFTILFSVSMVSDAYAFTEQRKFIGEEYDATTDLNYLNARYYNAKIGRFISEDPMFWSLPNDLLADPQQLNSYSYARNNPIVGSDPSGLVAVTVSGTTDLLNLNNNSSSNYLQDSKVLQNNIKNSFPGQDIYNFSWSGDNSDNARRQAAKDLSAYVSNIMKNYPSSEPLNFITDSHGFNNVALYTQDNNAHKINNLISFGAPFLPDYSPNESKIDNHISIYSNSDMVQRYGGNQLTFTGLIGAALFGNLGGKLGDMIHLGEFGFAGRQFSGALNQNVTSEVESGPISSHKDYRNNQNVWDKYISSYIKN